MKSNKKAFFFSSFLMLTCCIYPLSADGSPKIYDCSPFFNELEILEIKLNELYDSVDYFVICECTETFTGKPKPLYFDLNKQKFSQFLDKIIHVIVTEHIETNDPWVREAFQKNQVMRGLTNCHDEDIIIIGDLDEIVSGAKLPEVIDYLIRNRLRFVTCGQTMYSYYLNRQGHIGYENDLWLGSVVTRYADVKSVSPYTVRNSYRSRENLIPAGWHFTWMGGVDRVRSKLDSFSHSELNTEEFRSLARIQHHSDVLPLVEIDASYPQFIRDNIPYFTEIGFIDLSGAQGPL